METVNPEHVSNRADFCSFVDALRSELTSKESEWVNSNLSDYLEALSAWVRDMDGFYENKGLAVPESFSWSDLAQMLNVAKYYE